MVQRATMGRLRTKTNEKKKKRKQTGEKDWKVKRKKNKEYDESQITTICKFLCVAGYVNIDKYTNYNIIKIYINRLKVTFATKVFFAIK